MTEQTASPATPGRARIALVAFGSLGDGLLYLMMAENLRHNGYNVSYYGDIAHQIRHWMPQLDIHPYPPHDGFDAALADYDLVIMSPPQFLRDRMDERTLDAMRKKWLLICQRAPTSWRHDLTATLRTQLPPEIYAELHDLLDCGGPIRFRKFADASVVDITLAYLRERMHLKQLTRQVMLTPPAGLAHRRHRHRIVVSPDSAWPEKKDWPARSFLRLCHALRARGYDPKIVVAPANHGHWTKLPGNVFDTPVFPGIDQLAAYLYESAAVIANDSGNGHLASFLGIPVVTIYRKRNPKFHWRPDWGPTRVVCPQLTLPWLGGSIWKPFVGVAAVLAALDQLT